jgi:hypothetical protein
MSVVKRVATIFVGTVLTGLYLAVPAGADPGFDPCHSSITFFCRMLPMMPDLDHDVDLTQDPDGLTGGQSFGDQPGPANQPGPGNQPGADLGGG